jgi:hypothetical protein
MFFDEEPKRTKPTATLKRMVFERDEGICRVCTKKIDLFSFEIGHDKAHSKGGKLTLKNSILICSPCNKSMRTLTLRQVRKDLGLLDTNEKVKKALNKLSMKELKYLAKVKDIKPKGKVSEGLFASTTIAPFKRQYVTALAKEMSEEQIQQNLKNMPKETKKKRNKKSNSLFF